MNAAQPCKYWVNLGHRRLLIDGRREPECGQAIAVFSPSDDPVRVVCYSPGMEPGLILGCVELEERPVPALNAGRYLEETLR